MSANPAIAGFALLLFAGHASAQAAGQAAAERFVLTNGLEVVLEPDPASARIAVVVAYRAGLTSDPPELPGLAHLTEHMAFRGSLHVGEQGFFDLPQHWGTSGNNAFTSADATVYQTIIPAEQLARALWLESERMGFMLPALRAEHVALERRIVANEYAMRGDLGLARLVNELSYPDGHPQRAFSPDAAKSALPAIDLGAVQWFFQRVYRPDNATLVLVGAFERDEAKRLIERYFANIGNPRVPRLASVEQRVQFGGSARARVRARSNSESLFQIWTLPAGAYDERRAAITGLALVLDKRVNEQLAHGSGIPNKIRTSWDRSAGGDRFTIQVTTAVRGKLAEIGRVLEAELANLRSTPLTATELTSLRRQLSWRLLHQRETVWYRALLHATDRPPGSTAPFDYAALGTALRELRADQLTAAARDLLPVERRLVVEQEAAAAMPGAALISIEGELFPAARPGPP